MNRSFVLFFVLAGSLAGSAAADPAFLTQAAASLDAGDFAQAQALAQKVLAQNPDDADALVVSGTALLYHKAVLVRDESIYKPTVDPAQAPEPQVPADVALAVADLWKRVPALDPSRTYLWGDLAQMVYRAGAPARALEFAQAALNAPDSDADALKAAASVFVLNLDWARAAKALARIPGNRTALLYQGLDAWLTGKDNWRAPLLAFAQDPGPDPAGAQLAAYLAGPQMRDGDAGYQAALRVETGVAALAVKQKYVDRYPNQFLPRLDLARTLSTYGSYDKALFHYGEIDRKALASSADEKQTVLFQEAWAYQAQAKTAEAGRLWRLLTNAKDFYVRSAAAWFLGKQALVEGKPAEAKALWTYQPLSPPRIAAPNSTVSPPELMPSVADEAGRSKYAAWAASELKKLP